MTRDEWKDAFMMGARCKGPITPGDGTIDYLLDTVWDNNEQITLLQNMIADMNSVAAEASVKVECRSCGVYYEMSCDLSEFNPYYSYCGGSDRCCP